MDFTRGPDELHLQSLRSPTEGDSGILQERGRRERRTAAPKKKSRWGIDAAVIKDVEELLECVVITPPQQIVCTAEWRDHEVLRELSMRDKDVSKAIDLWKQRLVSWKIKDFYKFYFEEEDLQDRIRPKGLAKPMEILWFSDLSEEEKRNVDPNYTPAVQEDRGTKPMSGSQRQAYQFASAFDSMFGPGPDPRIQELATDKRLTKEPAGLEFMAHKVALEIPNVELPSFYTYPQLKKDKQFLFQDIYAHGHLYYSLEESVKNCKAFLEWQFGDPKPFLTNLVDVLDFRIPKRNTIDVLSPPSCGKTWFFDMVCDFFLNVGHLKNFNKYQSFPFQDCKDRRLIIWNEPNTAPEHLDTLKTLFGGDRCAAAMKFEGDYVINRTPLICTGNSRVFPSSDAMNVRRFLYEFRPWPALKEIGEKKLFPPAFPCVLLDYEIQF